MTLVAGRLPRRRVPHIGGGTIALAVAAALGGWMLYGPAEDVLPTAVPHIAPVWSRESAPMAPVAAPSLAAAIRLSDLISPLGIAAKPLSRSTPLDSALIAMAPIAAAPPIVVATPKAVEPPDTVIIAEAIPVPTPRPLDFQVPAVPRDVPLAAPATPTQPLFRPRPKPLVAARMPPPEKRGFFERLFGAPRAEGPVLAYAAPETNVITESRRAIPRVPTTGQTAIYDISAHTVYMPDGTQLEAHSGLGQMLDDPHFVHQRNRGPTPPQTYDLTLRESLFHGVQALRLSPVGGGGVYGRDGLLAHTYMLGPNGQSNGCVSFRNYNAFLQAYHSGLIRRLLVVASR